MYKEEEEEEDEEEEGGRGRGQDFCIYIQKFLNFSHSPLRRRGSHTVFILFSFSKKKTSDKMSSKSNTEKKEISCDVFNVPYSLNQYCVIKTKNILDLKFPILIEKWFPLLPEQRLKYQAQENGK